MSGAPPMFKNLFQRKSAMNKTPDILKQILQRKAEEIEVNARQVSLRRLSHLAANRLPPRSFIEAINARLQLQQPAIIAEVKKASPSKGVLRENFDPIAIARSYEEHGATCLSVLPRFFPRC